LVDRRGFATYGHATRYSTESREELPHRHQANRCATRRGMCLLRPFQQ
jgi:hypothetical protein